MMGTLSSFDPFHMVSGVLGKCVILESVCVMCWGASAMHAANDAMTHFDICTVLWQTKRIKGVASS